LANRRPSFDQKPLESGNQLLERPRRKQEEASNAKTSLVIELFHSAGDHISLSTRVLLDKVSWAKSTELQRALLQ
jgi:hypothetical protein